VKTQVLFPLKREVCLEATTAVQVYLPAGILLEGEKMEDVITLSGDDIEIGLKESNQSQKKASAIIIFLKANDRILLHRSSEIMIQSNDKSEVVFNIVA